MLMLNQQLYCCLRSVGACTRRFITCHKTVRLSYALHTREKHSLKFFKNSSATLEGEEDPDSLVAFAFAKYSPTLRSLRSKMDVSLLMPPSSVRGMTSLDRKSFDKEVTIPLIRVKNENMQSALKHFKKLMLKMEKLKPVQNDADDMSKKIILLNPLLVRTLDDISKEFEELCGDGEAEFLSRAITLSYENWKADDIIKAVLPENQEGAQGYSLIGHILHLNLREHVLPYKTVIGEVLLEKIPNITLVVNKTNIIDTTYRNFEMEVLAGTGKTDVTVRENGCSFSFDFEKVYWNPRLSTEHERITRKLKHGDVLYDVMAGVGPFAIPAGRKKCRVLANDLNPYSYEALERNCSSNKVTERVKCYNLDGHEFIRTVVKEDMLKTWKDPDFIGAIHITMNLPAMAVEFLPSFIDVFYKSDNVPVNVNLPLVHVYMFTNDEEKDSAIAMVVDKLKCKIPEENAKDAQSKDSNNGINSETEVDASKSECDVEGFRQYVEEVAFVRAVAPNKNMMRVSFKMPLKIMTGNDAVEPPSKKLKKTSRWDK